MKKCKLVIEFRSMQDMGDWFDDLRDPALGAFPVEAAIYRIDALDNVASGEVFIVKRLGDRPEMFRATFTTVTEETKFAGGPQ